MKKIITKLTLVTILILASGFWSAMKAQTSPANTPAVSSQYATVSQRVGITEISISYSRPRVLGRKIWGGLVPFGYKSFTLISGKADGPWRTGANHIPVISFEHDVKINGHHLDAGAYGMSMAIFENGDVDIIFNRNTKSWGVFGYDQTDDVLKIKVQSEELAEFKEAMAFEFFDGTQTSVEIALLWANKKIPFEIEIDTKEIVYAGLLREQAAFKAMSTFPAWNIGAAMYLMNNNFQLDQAIAWMVPAIGTQDAPTAFRNFRNLTIQANLYLLNGQPEEATPLLNEAFEIPPATIGVFTSNFYGNQVLGLGFPKVAIRAFEFAGRSFENNQWPSKNGLAKAYSAMGNYKAALEHLQAALPFAPEGYDKEAYNQNIQKLKEGKDIN